MDIQAAEGNEDHHLQILKEAETILQSKKAELERLKGQVSTADCGGGRDRFRGGLPKS